MMPTANPPVSVRVSPSERELLEVAAQQTRSKLTISSGESDRGGGNAKCSISAW